MYPVLSPPATSEFRWRDPAVPEVLSATSVANRNERAERVTEPDLRSACQCKDFPAVAMPFIFLRPTDLKVRPEPTARSFTVLETRIVPGSDSAMIRATRCTARPLRSPPRRSHSPVWIPMRRSSPRAFASHSSVCAHSMAELGPVNARRYPSPVCFICCPPKALNVGSYSRREVQGASATDHPRERLVPRLNRQCPSLRAPARTLPTSCCR